MSKAKSKKKSTVLVTEQGYAYVKATFNNTIVTLTNKKGETVAWSSAGKVGFKGSKKNTPYAAIQAVKDCAEKAIKAGLKKVVARIKGVSIAQEHAIRALASVGLEIIKIEECTPIPHNGCRAPKKK